MTSPAPSEFCEHCDLPRWACEHRAAGDVAPAEAVDRPAPPARLVRWASYFDGDEYKAEWGHGPGDGDAGLIECTEAHNAGDAWLCRACTAQVVALLKDLPALIYDLSLARTRQTAFVARGTKPWQDNGTADEVSPLPYDDKAAAVMATLARLLGCDGMANMAVRARWMAGAKPFLRNREAAAWAHDLSVAYQRGHHVIERPEPLVYTGTCPNGHDLWTERDASTVSCTCGYTAVMGDHRRAALDAGEDRWLTVGELVGAITKAGEAVTRDQINSWIRREGLVREQHTRPVWREGKLLARTVYVYRLGDVRALAQRAGRKRAG